MRGRDTGGRRRAVASGQVNLARLVVVVVTRVPTLIGVAPALAAAVVLGVEVAPGQPLVDADSWRHELTVVPTGCGEPE